MAQNLSNLAVGAKVAVPVNSAYQSRFGSKIVFKIADKNHSGYPSNSVTLITEKIIQLMCSDAIEASNSNSDRKSGGNNRHIHSNLLQWLNSNAAAGAWYSAQHDADAPPTNANVYGNYNEYDQWAGFLAMLDPNFVSSLLNTTLTVAKSTTDGGSYETFERKMFHASTTEVGLANENSIAEGSLLALFSYAASRVAYPTAECVSNSEYTNANLTTAKGWYWWLRTPASPGAQYVRYVDSNGTSNYSSAYNGSRGVRPLCNLSSSILVSDTTDSDGCYTFVWNAPPTPPSSINVPASIYGGKTNVISWGASTDPDGNLSGYSLERAYNGGSFSTIYTGANLTYTDTVEYGKTTVRYRVRAYDAAGAYSTYTTSAERSVINNQPPVISGSDANLGTKTTPFTRTYQVTDADTDAVTVVERIDGVLIRSYSVVLDATNIFSVTGTTWLKQTNGTHSMTVTASDSYGNNTVRTYTFTKNVTSFSILTAIPMESSTMPTRLSMSISRNIPPESTFLVEVCNNGFDASPTWEDATSAVISNFAHVFGNTTKTAASWGVSIRITVNRNGASGACYVNAIGGNFE